MNDDQSASRTGFVDRDSRLAEPDLSKHPHASRVTLEDPMPLSKVLDELRELLIRRETEKD